ncbi:A24 family peptidase [Paraferrimonas sp. SM1919]|uniref:prepilin peptidase n=1 Tax=Paraferrimonas sp. SM1919 TaxID=2662263 RepID=UPI0013D04081|nr:A24 family peptidase [Paraferrimonas sp. SM1919]
MNALIELFQQSLFFWLFSCFVVGLCVGSFINVVCWRLPIMIANETNEDKDNFNLSWPNSYCPSCNTAIKVSDNIPILSYLLLQGKCRSCNSPISPQYPLIELVSGCILVVIGYYFGVSLPFLFYSAASLILLALVIIDVKHMLLPDLLNYCLLWLGLLASVCDVSIAADDAIIGAIAGYLSLWSLYWAFKLITHKEGLGYGDFKLVAAIGSWIGWQLLPLLLLIAAVLGLIYAVAIGRLKQSQQPIAFGPFIAFAGLACIFAGDKLWQSYTNFIIG